MGIMQMNNNIAIVGVEQSGKTAPMAAMGDKYNSPDVNETFLKPVNREILPASRNWKAGKATLLFKRTIAKYSLRLRASV